MGRSELEHCFRHRMLLEGADQEEQTWGSDGLKELFPDRGLGFPVKEGEEERGAGKESGERRGQRRRLE